MQTQNAVKPNSHRKDAVTPSHAFSNRIHVCQGGCVARLVLCTALVFPDLLVGSSTTTVVGRIGGVGSFVVLFDVSFK